MKTNHSSYRFAFAFAMIATLLLGYVRLRASAAPEAPGVHGQASNVTMTFTDPKTGKTLWTARVKRVEATSHTKANDVFGTLHEVDGTLYQDSVPADRLQAPTVTVDNATQVVVASGGATITSITQADTKVTADTITYYSADGKIVGVGHVTFKKGGFTQKGPSFAADVKLKSVVMPAPNVPDGAASGVHAQWTNTK